MKKQKKVTDKKKTTTQFIIRYLKTWEMLRSSHGFLKRSLWPLNLLIVELKFNINLIIELETMLEMRRVNYIYSDPHAKKLDYAIS